LELLLTGLPPLAGLDRPAEAGLLEPAAELGLLEPTLATDPPPVTPLGPPRTPLLDLGLAPATALLPPAPALPLAGLRMT
jgi:hypothetical protein